MPLVNYCKKCKTEVPQGESCPYCGAKLTQTGEQLSFGAVRVPIRDWFAWNNVLRILLPVWGLVWVVAVVSELCTTGTDGVERLFSQGFFWLMLTVLAIMLGLLTVLLWLQGAEKVHYVLDKDGVHARTYLARPTPLKLYARFLSPQTIEVTQQRDDRRPLEGLTLVRRVTLPWNKVRRVRLWQEGGAALFFSPSYWQALAIRCPLQEAVQVEAFARKKLKRYKKVKVLPQIQAEKKKKDKSIT